jgi:hypothetical protein
MNAARGVPGSDDGNVPPVASTRRAAWFAPDATARFEIARYQPGVLSQNSFSLRPLPLEEVVVRDYGARRALLIFVCVS